MYQIVVLDEKEASTLAKSIGETGLKVFRVVKNEKSVRGLARELKLAPSTVCYHLDQLKKLGLIREVKHEHGDRRIKLYKTTSTNAAYLVLLNFSKEDKDALMADLSASLSKKGFIVRDFISLLLAIGIGLEIWAISQRPVIPPGLDVMISQPRPLLLDILLTVLLFTALICLQRNRILNAFKIIAKRMR
jgi:DNA-binding MarR family transcriptional regulator